MVHEQLSSGTGQPQSGWVVGREEPKPPSTGYLTTRRRLVASADGALDNLLD